MQPLIILNNLKPLALSRLGQILGKNRVLEVSIFLGPKEQVPESLEPSLALLLGLLLVALAVLVLVL